MAGFAKVGHAPDMAGFCFDSITTANEFCAINDMRIDCNGKNPARSGDLKRPGGQKYASNRD
jgi:hypothetical protein